MQGIFVVPVNPEILILYQLIHVFFISLCSGLFVVLREQQILTILFPRKPLNFDIVNVAVIYGLMYDLFNCSLVATRWQ
jgi:hypothetical protein